uniref:Phospholipid phosphatase related 3b n=1 Tax=Sphaeramia orbicularis TaxID=375764 RepID=A0A672ZXM8_9TELE
QTFTCLLTFLCVCVLVLQLPIVASSMVSLYFLELTDLVQPAQVGFRCHDRDLSMPYVDGGDELIPLLMLLSLAFAGPAASVTPVQAQAPPSRRKHHAGGCNFNSFLRRTVRFVGVHVFGLCATALVTDIIQLATGYHAPFFLTVCKPNYTLAGVSCDKNPYITKDICAGHDQHAIMAARWTFPSQHATLSAFAAVYRAALTGLTQITQHRSHPIDSTWASLSEPSSPSASADGARTRVVYNKGPASASERHDEIAAAPAPLERTGRSGAPAAEKGSMGSLKRASVDVELLAPAAPMGRQTMLTLQQHAATGQHERQRGPGLHGDERSERPGRGGARGQRGGVGGGVCGHRRRRLPGKGGPGLESRSVPKYGFCNISRYFISQYCIDIQKYCIDIFRYLFKCRYGGGSFLFFFIVYILFIII